MDSDKNQSNVGGLKHGGTKQPEQKRKRHFPHQQDHQYGQHPLGVEDVVRELHKIREEMANSSTESKIEEKKNNALVAKMAEMETRLELAELKAKEANEQMAKTVESKLAELTGQLAEKLRKAEKKIADLELALTNKMEEGNAKLHSKFINVVQGNQRKFYEQIAGHNQCLDAEFGKMARHLNQGIAKLGENVAKFEGQFQENQQKFSGIEAKMVEKDKKLEHLEKLAKAIDQGMAAFGEKLLALENHAADGQNKLEEFAGKLASNLESKGNESSNKDLWKHNRWDIAGHVQLADTGAYWTNLHAAQPISRALLSSVPGRLVYYETLFKIDPLVSQFFCYIGWIGPDCPLMNQGWVGHIPGSFAINHSGEHWDSNCKLTGYGEGFQSGDLIGSGLLFTRDGQLKLFFTKNCRLNGKPIVMPKEIDQNMLLYPAASFFPKNQASVEANFGADPGKPFKFDLDANKARIELNL